MYANIYLPYGKRTESGGEVSWQLLREMYHNLYINIILKALTSEKNTNSDYSDIFTFWRFSAISLQDCCCLAGSGPYLFINIVTERLAIIHGYHIS